jgi:hypothetical protein
MWTRSPFIEPRLVDLTSDCLVDGNSEKVDSAGTITFDMTTFATQRIAHILVEVLFFEKEMEHPMTAPGCIDRPQYI